MIVVAFLIFTSTISNAIAALGNRAQQGPSQEQPPVAVAPIITAEPDTDESTAEPITPVEPADAESEPAGEPEPAAEPLAPSAPYGLAYPADQAAFVERIEAASSAFDEATTDLQRSQVIQQRNTDLCGIVSDGAFSNWVGRATTLGGTGEGNAHIDVEISPDVIVGTWNNQISDIGDNTLIPPGSALFDTLVGMDEDTLIVFSGRFMADDGSCVYTSNMTEMFDAWSPDFITHVTAVEPQ